MFAHRFYEVDAMLGTGSAIYDWRRNSEAGANSNLDLLKKVANLKWANLGNVRSMPDTQLVIFYHKNKTISGKYLRVDSGC